MLMLKRRRYGAVMCTTLDLDEAVLAAAGALSQGTGTSFGAAVSELARRGLQPRLVDDGFTTFSVTGEIAAITSAMVREAPDR